MGWSVGPEIINQLSYFANLVSDEIGVQLCLFDPETSESDEQLMNKTRGDPEILNVSIDITKYMRRILYIKNTKMNYHLLKI